MASRFDRYLRTLKREARLYGIDPLFVRTKTVENCTDGFEVSYKSPVLGRGKNARALNFLSYFEIESVDEDKFVRPEKAVKLKNRGLYIAIIEQPIGSRLVELKINDDKVRSFIFDVSLIESVDGDRLGAIQTYVVEEFNAPEILKLMVSIYDLGVERFLRESESDFLAA